jgi:hypothetical protein
MGRSPVLISAILRWNLLAAPVSFAVWIEAALEIEATDRCPLVPLLLCQLLAVHQICRSRSPSR